MGFERVFGGRGRFVAAAALAGMLTAAVVTPSPGSTQESGTSTVADGDTFALNNETVSGAYILACVNDYCPSATGSGGYIGAFKARDSSGSEYLAYCSEAGALAQVDTFYTYNEVSLDGRLRYLT